MDVICRTCCDVIANGLPYFSLNGNDPDSFKEKLEACVPELAVNLVKNAVVCSQCVDALSAAYKFKKTCLETDEKIYNYLQSIDAESESIDMGKVFRWSSKFNSCSCPLLENTIPDNGNSHETIHEEVVSSDITVSCSPESALNTNISDSNKTSDKVVTNRYDIVSCNLETIDKIIENIHTSADINKNSFGRIIQDAVGLSSDHNNIVDATPDTSETYNFGGNIAEKSLEESPNAKDVETTSVLINCSAEDFSREPPNAGIVSEINRIDDVSGYPATQSTLAATSSEDNNYSNNDTVACSRKKNRRKQTLQPRIDSSPIWPRKKGSKSRSKLKSSSTQLDELDDTHTKIKARRNRNTSKFNDILVCSLKPSDSGMDVENIAEDTKNLEDTSIKPEMVNWSAVENVNSSSLDVSNPAYTDVNYFDVEEVTIKMEKYELDEQKYLLQEDIKPVIVNQPAVSIIAGMSCNFEDFCDFEQQYLGYTMNEFYSNQLVTLPECSVIVTPLSNAELEKWTRGDCSDSKKTPKRRSRKPARIRERRNPKRIFSAHMKNDSHVTKLNIMNTKKGLKKTRLNLHRSFRCVQCNYSAKYECSLKFHMKLHGEREAQNRLHIYSCKLCEYSSLFEDRLLKHRKRVHVKNNVYRCRECLFHTTDRYDWRKHVGYHIGYTYKCISCTYSTLYQKNLKKHYRHCHFLCHPYVCSLCTGLYDDQASLIEHVLNHPKTKSDIIYIEHNYSTCRR